MSEHDELRLEIQALLGDLNVEVLLVPTDNHYKAKQMLEDKLDEVSRMKFIYEVNNLLDEFADQIVEQGYKVPTQMSLDFYEEYDDEGGTDTRIQSVSWFDEDGHYIDLEEVVVKYIDTNWRGEKSEREDNLDEYLRECIRDANSPSELENLFGEGKFSLIEE
jgi:hypothetical protein